MRNNFFMLSLLLLCLGSLAYATAPTITSFNPTSGPVGTVVTVIGSNLATAPTVSVHGTTASVNVTTLTLTIAPGTTTGPISITTPGGTATSATSFFVTSTAQQAPTITSFTPSSGLYFTVVTISGTNFNNASSLKFNGTAASTFTLVNATTIRATVNTGTTSGPISVTTPGGTATSTTNFTVVMPPTISSFTPLSAAVGATVTLTGQYFTNASAVKFNGVATSTFSVVNDTTITAIVPNNVTSGKISVTTPGGSATSSASFSVIALPIIYSFTPSSGPLFTTVTITGSNFANTSAVKFNGTAASTYSLVSNTSISARVNTGTTSGPISVTTPGGTATSSMPFTVILSPTIASFTPGSGGMGTVVTLTGTHYTGTTAVAFGGTAAASFSVVSDTSLTATVGSGTSGKITVTNPAGTATSTATFTLLPAPSIASFVPASGNAGTVVTLTGTNFTGATVVKFGTMAASSFTVVNATTITATVNLGTTGKITVITPGGTGVSAASFTVNYGAGTPGTNPIDSAAMVWVPGGSFTMGTPYGLTNTPTDGSPATQQVTLTGYWIYTEPVTVAQYRAFCSSTSHAMPTWPTNIYTGYTDWTDSRVQQMPIANVGLDDANAYASWAGVVLPTEAQFEYAARGPQGNNYPWGGTATAADQDNGWDQTMCANGWNTYAQGGGGPWPVGSFPQGASWCGAQDLAGEIEEWCADWYGDYSSTPVTDPIGAGMYHVLRGGAWYSGADPCRGAFRYFAALPYQSQWGYSGFRCVKVAPGPSAPSITSFAPTSGNAGTVVTLTGVNFTGATSVKFGVMAATSFSVVSATSITATVNLGTTGKITVITPAGTAISATSFTVNHSAGTAGINPIDYAAMVWAPGGSFTMGSPYGQTNTPTDGSPATQQVTLTGYWIYTEPVTVAQYRAFCSSTAHAMPAWPTNIFSGNADWTASSLQQLPIANVTVEDAKAYASWAGVSLPTEAQFEYAARGPQGNNYPWGGMATAADPTNGWDPTKSPSGTGLSAVGSFPQGASWCGAQDLVGEMEEWCADWYGDYSSTPVTDPTGPTVGSYHVLRGGWYFSEPFTCRGAFRYFDYLPYQSQWGYSGFRCVKVAPGP